MTLKDIAQLAGVSVATVSRVLNDRDTKSASKEVSERIWQIIRETGYVPNSNARRLRTSDPAPKSAAQKYYACIFARSNNKNNMFFTELSRAIESEAYKKGYVLKCTYYAEELRKQSFAAELKAQQIKGLAVLGRFERPEVQAVFEAQQNVVYVGLLPIHGKHDAVYCDGYGAGILAMDTLFSLGHTGIAYLGAVSGEVRYNSYCDSLAKRGIALDRSMIVNIKQTIEGGYYGAQTLFKRGTQCTAIFCSNDAAAMGCIKCAHEHRIKVPEDLSVISVDDVEAARYFMPMLTTVHIPIDELGKQAAKILVDRIEKGHTLPMKLELPYSLSNRDTCGHCKKR